MEFQQTVWDYYRCNARKLPWREPEPDGTFEAYKILLSEMMLQQTQVARVVPKYQAFLQLFPDIQSLAKAPLSDVLTAWSGLGYNRRAQYLHAAAKYLMSKGNPWKVEDLTVCKGIGPNTAAAVVVYAYNQPAFFIETNIRTVYIHHFFSGRLQVSDEEILDLVKLTLPSREEQPERSGFPSPGAISGSPAKEDFRWGGVRNPEGVSHYREWYWALMDYGSFLKASAGNAARFSKHHTKQPAFEGSRRQVRGQILRLLTNKPLSLLEFEQNITDERLAQVLLELEAEELITRQNLLYALAT